jgi:hypothetical protein
MLVRVAGTAAAAAVSEARVVLSSAVVGFEAPPWALKSVMVYIKTENWWVRLD